MVEAFCKYSELGGRSNGREGRTRVGKAEMRLLQGHRYTEIVREKKESKLQWFLNFSVTKKKNFSVTKIFFIWLVGYHHIP